MVASGAGNTYAVTGRDVGEVSGKAPYLANQEICISQRGGDFLLLAGYGYVSEVAATVRTESSPMV